jgi:hypothetical protein
MCNIKNLKTIGQSYRGKPLFLSVAVFAFLLTLPFSIGDKIVGSSELNLVTDPSTVLSQYGEIIYQYNEKSPQQLFVIAMSHRDSLTRRNGSQTSRIQAEIYKIGEWLIHNRELELLLPEGYFAGRRGKIENENLNVALEKKSDCPAPVDMDTLEKILSDNRTFVNAEMLLRDNYPSLKIRQVEDRALYETARKRITELIDQKNSCDYLLLRSELDYLQERRTAAILQRIPEIVNEEFQQGHIKGRVAILTIGMSHAHKIIRYLNDHKITVYSPLDKSNKGEDYTAELNLEKEKFGVTVILPKTLVDNQRILELNHLDKIVAQYRNRSSRLSSAVLP